MEDALQVLMLEDEPTDAELAEHELKKAGIVFSSRRVDCRDAFVAALAERRPDIILADYKLPAFDGLAALGIAREKAPTVPFIFVSGAMGEEFAIEMLHQGAADYVLKEHLSKLVPAVRRALVDAEEHRRRQQADAALRCSNRFLRTLSRCNETLVHAADERELLQQMCRVVVEVGEFALAWVGYVEPDGSIRPVAQFGARAAEYVGTLALGGETEAARSLTVKAVRSGEIQIVQDIDAADAPWRAQAIEYGFCSRIVLPLGTAGTVIGSLNIYAAEAGGFGEEETGLLSELASDLAFGINGLRLRAEREEGARRLAQALADTIRAIASMIEARDPYTAGHQRRVAQLAGAIARELGLAEDCVVGVQRGADIHDIGKTYIPAEILSRPGRLSEAEFSLIKIHPQVGYDIVKDIEFPWPVAQMILQHHERLDGSGYPQGLATPAGIILEARILAVADVVDAMVSHRPYRAALGVEAALAEIQRHRGRLYDAAVADACLCLFRDKGFTFD